MNVRPSQIDVFRVVQISIESLRTSGGIGVVEVAEALSNNAAEWQGLGELSTDGVLTPAAMPSPANVVVDREVQAAIESVDLEAGQVQRRVLQEDQKAAQIQALEMEKVPERLYAFVERGTITGDEAKTIRQLHNVDENLKRGEIDIEEASRVCKSLMDGEARSEIESKVRETVEQNSRYIQVFEALRKINPESDDGLEVAAFNCR
jgi:hypothetical protein